ncbi:MAG: hypothetical protein ACYC7F_02375 [Gemmatimonadaceae bacterium]
MKLRTKNWQSRLLEFMRQKGPSVYRRLELITAVRNDGSGIGIPDGTKDSTIVEILGSDGDLREIQLESPATAKHGVAYKTMKRLAWGEPSANQIAIALRTASYLSHGTAAALHGLSGSAMGDAIYVNKEQTEKPRGQGALTQAAIDRAFKNAARSSNYVYAISGARIVLLSGKNTGRLGVTAHRQQDGVDLPCTDLERTLIDLTVRPNYAGGVNMVLAAFVAARGRADVGRLAELLRRIDYLYPYQQAVGFYCERAGYDASDLGELAKNKLAFDFYLTHAMSKPRHDQRWRIFYPRTLD